MNPRWKTEKDLLNAVNEVRGRLRSQAAAGTIILVDHDRVLISADDLFYLDPLTSIDTLIDAIPASELHNAAKINLILAKHRLSDQHKDEGTYAFGIRSRGFNEVIGLMATDLYFRRQDWLFFQAWSSFSSRIQFWFNESITTVRTEHDDYYSLVYE